MSLEAQRIDFTNMDIYNNGSDLYFDSPSGTITLTPVSNITASGETLDMDGNSILTTSGCTSQSGQNMTIEASGTGELIFRAPNTQTPPMMQIDTAGITYWNAVPTTSAGIATSANQMLRYANFSTQTAYTPTISGTTAGTPTYSSQSGLYTRVGNLVWFRAAMVVTGTTGLTASDNIRLSLPISVDYTSLAMPQALILSAFEGISPTNTDIACGFGGNGSSAPGSSINYCNLFYRATNTSTGTSPLNINDLTLPATIRYGGVYYAF